MCGCKGTIVQPRLNGRNATAIARGLAVGRSLRAGATARPTPAPAPAPTVVRRAAPPVNAPPTAPKRAPVALVVPKKVVRVVSRQRAAAAPKRTMAPAPAPAPMSVPKSKSVVMPSQPPFSTQHPVLKVTTELSPAEALTHAKKILNEMMTGRLAVVATSSKPVEPQRRVEHKAAPRQAPSRQALQFHPPPTRPSPKDATKTTAPPPPPKKAPATAPAQTTEKVESTRGKTGYRTASVRSLGPSAALIRLKAASASAR